MAATTKRARKRSRAKPIGSALRSATRGQKLTVYLPERLARELKAFAAKERRSLSDAVTESVQTLLAAER